MDLAKVIGSVWATQKDEQLVGNKMRLIQPVNSQMQSTNAPMIAVDTVDAGIGNLVFYITAYEAVLPLKKQPALCDASIIGIIDNIEVEK